MTKTTAGAQRGTLHLATDDGRVHLYRGDALRVLESLPDASADAVITDPPYSSGGFTRSDKMEDPASKYVQDGVAVDRATFSGDNMDVRSWAYWMGTWLAECTRVIREHGYLLTFTDWRQLPTTTDVYQAARFVWRGIVVWDKTAGARAPHKGYFRHQAEYVVWGTLGGCRIATYGGPWDGVIRCSIRQSDKHHLTGKPTEVMKRLVVCVPPAAVVVDPFMGSGTTGVACLRTGRRFVGVELSAKYFEVARERLQRHLGAGYPLRAV